MRSERFKWSRASRFSYKRNAIGLAIAYTSAIRTHLSVHGTAQPISSACVRPRAAADYLIRSAAEISHPRQQGTPRAGSSVASGPVHSDIINGLGAGANGGVGNHSLSPKMDTGAVAVSVASASVVVESIY